MTTTDSTVLSAEPTAAEPTARGSDALAIGVLSITAVILLVGILVVTAINDRALAAGQTDRGGDYIVLGVQFNSGTETVALTDAAAQKVNVYGFDLSSKRIAIWSSQDLKRLQNQAQGLGAGKNAPPRRGGGGARKGGSGNRP